MLCVIAVEERIIPMVKEALGQSAIPGLQTVYCPTAEQVSSLGVNHADVDVVVVSRTLSRDTGEALLPMVRNMFPYAEVMILAGPEKEAKAYIEKARALGIKHMITGSLNTDTPYALLLFALRSKTGNMARKMVPPAPGGPGKAAGMDQSGPPGEETSEADAARSVTAPAPLPQQGGCIIAVYSPSARVGKTAVALSLACAVAATGGHVCLVDADPTGDTLSEHFAGLGTGRQAFRTVRPSGWSFDLLPGPLNALEYTAESAKWVLSLRYSYDLMIVDTSPGMLEVYQHIREFLFGSDRVCLICTPETRTISAMRRFLLGSGKAIPRSKTMLVANRAASSDNDIEIGALLKDSELETFSKLPESGIIQDMFLNARLPKSDEILGFLTPDLKLLTQMVKTCHCKGSLEGNEEMM